MSLSVCKNCGNEVTMKLRNVYKICSKSLRHVVVCDKCGVNGPVTVYYNDAKNGWNEMNNE